MNIPRKKLRSILLVLLLIALLIGAVREYRAQQIRAKTYTGTIEATQADITAKTSGYLKALHIQEGQSITKGTLAAELERKDLNAAEQRDRAAYQTAAAKLQTLVNGSRPEELQEAAAKTASLEAAAEQAGRDAQRMTSLYQSQAIAKQTLEEAYTRQKSAQKEFQAAKAHEDLLRAGTRSEEIKTAQKQLEEAAAVLKLSASLTADLSILSPLTGVILKKNYEPGEYVTAGTPLATVVDLSDCWVRIYVSAEDLHRIKVGDEVPVKIDGLSQPLTGKIREISDKAEYTPRQSLTKEERAHMVFSVKIALENAQGILKPGMPADVIFHE